MSDDRLKNDDKNAHLSPTLRGRLQQCYEFGNQKMQAGEYDYANEMFCQCFLGNPANLIYLQSFVANLRLKYKNNKKGASSFAKLKGGSYKTAMKVAESRGKWADLLKAGVELLKLNPWDSSAYFPMGKATLAMGHDDTGLALLKHAVECSPNDVEINRFAANELGERERYEDALACVQRILNVKKDDRDASKMMGDLMLRRTMRGMETKKERKEQDIAHASTLSPVNVEDQFEKRLRKTPEDRDLWLEFANHYFQKKNYRRAEETYRRAAEQFPDDADILMRIAELAKIRAKENFLQTKALFDKNPVEELKAKLIQQKKEFAQRSLELIQRKLKQNPSGTLVRYEYGFFLMQHGKFREAIVELQTAQQDEGLRADCFLAIAQCFERVGQEKLALSHYEKAIAAYGHKVGEPLKQALYLGAQLAFRLEDYERAEKYAGELAAVDFSYKDLGALLDKIAAKRQNR